MTPVRLVHLNVGGPTHVVEHAGRVWRFEEHGFFGPLVLRRDGAPVKRQPGVRSPFWAAYAAWCAQWRRP